MAVQLVLLYRRLGLSLRVPGKVGRYFCSPTTGLLFADLLSCSLHVTCDMDGIARRSSITDERASQNQNTPTFLLMDREKKAEMDGMG